ncbi:MAG: alpha/beta fold hydrolase [Solirubrobacterales bacterium]|nr:alpha/beta fold hydrolase [Solirubrobacterales bacterium]
MTGSGTNTDRLQAVEVGFRTLPQRYLGAEPGFEATYRIILGDTGHSWEVRCTEHHARAHRGTTGREPDVILGSDAATWLALRSGEMTGIEAFRRRLLSARGNLDLAFGFEGLFRLEGGREPLVRLHEVRTPAGRISTLTTGEGPDLLLIHGLGGAKSSFLDTAAILSRRYRVHALDLPGFGSSSKPATARYDARWFADAVLDAMDALEIERAHIAGNSLGGRIAIELGLRHPERVAALALLCPAVAFVKRTYHPLVRALRPELALLPHQLRRTLIEDRFWSMFADRDNVDPSLGDTVVEEFRRTYASAGARIAFAAAARNIYLDEPFGRDGFYPRLAGLTVPSLFVWGAQDTVIAPIFSQHVADWLPSAQQLVLDDCGHVPQVERPQDTTQALERFFARFDERLHAGEPEQAAA